MKVIELLNKIANGEEVPKKIKWGCHIFERFVYKYRAIDELGEPDLFQMTDGISEDFLNDEVEIIEEDKKIEKLKLNYSHIKHVELPFFKEEILNYCDNLQYKINEIIDILNKGDDK